MGIVPAQRRFQCVATAPHVALPTAAGPVQRPEGFSEQLARPGESEAGYKAFSLDPLFEPAIFQQSPDDQSGHLEGVVGIGGRKLILVRRLDGPGQMLLDHRQHQFGQIVPPEVVRIIRRWTVQSVIEQPKAGREEFAARRVQWPEKSSAVSLKE
ncbi:hypothetical protein D9M69_481830 [compost metagenome]